MKSSLSQWLAGLLVVTGVLLLAKKGLSEEGKHGRAEKEHVHGKEEAHEGSHAHEEKEHEEGGENVGPDKGILENSHRQGFKLSPEAKSSFGILTIKVSNDRFSTVPTSAMVHTLSEVGVFRLRSDFFKRVDVTVKKRTLSEVTIESTALRAGDEVVLKGAAFLRIAEIDAEGGNEGGHSH